MSVQVQNLTESQGSTLRYLMTWRDSEDELVDLTGYEFRGAVKKKLNSEDPLATFSFEIADQITNKGEVTAILTAAQTAELPCRSTTAPTRTTTDFLYDMEVIFPNGDVSRFIEGTLNLSPEATTNE